MSGIANKVEQKVEQAVGYHSGDRGTTGRENFEDGTPLVPAGGNYTGAPTGTSGTGLTGNHGHSGLTGDHHTHGSGLTGNSGTGLTGNHGVGTGTHHGLSSETTARSDLGQTGHHHQDDNNKPGLMDKAKDALGMNKSHDSTTHSGTGLTGSHNNHGSTGSHGNTGLTGNQGNTANLGAGYNAVGYDDRGAGSTLNTLGGGENTTATGLTGGNVHRGHEHGLSGGHRNEGTHNTAAALGAGAVGSGLHDSHSHSHSHPHTGLGSGSTGATTSDNKGLSGLDRVGALDQNAHMYERTGASGPATTGAAGTDRFDTGKHHSSATSGLTGHNTSTGLLEGEGREHGTGGVSGILGTSDKDFLSNRDRISTTGAYNDEHRNASGPGGNSALTGREGSNLAYNPVAQADTSKAHVGPTGGAGGLSHGAHGHGVHDTSADLDEHGNPRKKGVMEKIKDAIL